MATFPTMYPDRHLTARVHGRAVSLLRHRERGSEGIQFAGVVFPLLLLIFGILQLALYYVTVLQAQSAAEIGVQISRAENSTLAAGIAAARQNITSIDIARDVDITGSRTATDTTITVTANSPTLIPFLTLPQVRSSAHGPIERVTR